MAGYLEAIAKRPGAIGYAFAEDVAAMRRLAEEAGEEAGIGNLVRKGMERGWNLTLDYLVEAPRLSGRVGGISTIILNTFWMLLLTLLFAAPLGVAAAVYLVEYAKQGPLVTILRLGTETLAGIPSIIFGLFGMLFFVNILHFGFGLLSGCLTLTLMILPTVVRTSEEALKSVSKALREGSLALGATKLQTIAKVVIPAAAPGILTGLILGIGRAVGETAALLFTMGSDYKAARGLFSSARVLSAHVYLLFAEGISFDRAFSTATVLILIVLAFNFAAKRLVGRMSRNAVA
jgi:phosphate transport system permease protein